MIPIFLISYNRLTCLKAMIDRFVEMGQGRIIVIDNHSTYEPLIDYLREIGKDLEVIYMPGNFGHTVMAEHFNYFQNRFNLDRTGFIYSDNDIIPTQECPNDLVSVLEILTNKYRTEKAGVGLRIDDLPESFLAKDALINWESKFWEEKIRDEELQIDLYPAAIDTTFSYYRPGQVPRWAGHGLRTGAPYLARHLPWYIDTSSPTEEELFYMKSASEFETHFPGRYRYEGGRLIT